MDKEEKINKLLSFDEDSNLALYEEVLDLSHELKTLNEQEIKKGDKGDTGEKGEPGTDGKDGKDGVNGKNGTDGKDGIDGVDGEDGKNGKDGENGKDGSPDTGLEIKAKLLALSEKDKLKLKDLGGFDELIRNIEKFGVTKKNGSYLPYSGITTTFFALNGADKGRAKNINFVSGPTLNVTLSGDTATITIPTGGTGTVITTNSVTGDGSAGSPIQLVNDSAAPGNSKLYGTNPSGTLGWYNQPAIFTNTVASVNPTVNDDNTLGYGTTSRWFNRLTTTSWVCNTAATGAADWRRELFDLARSNLGAGVDPTGSDDNTLGYLVGSLWHNIITGGFFICDANTTGAAVWASLRGISSTLASGNIIVGNSSNVATSVAMGGQASISNTGVVTLDNNSVIGKVITGYTSGAGVVAATDTILQAIQKLNGNIGALTTGVSSVFGRTGAVTAQAADYSGVAMTGITSLNGLVITANTGVITTGTWNAGVITGQYGGTGVANTGLTITLGGNLITTGAFNTTFAASATATYTLPSATSTLLANNLGISGGSTLIGGIASGENLTLSSTSHAIKGKVIFGSASVYDQVNDRFGITQTTPLSRLHINFDGNSSSATADDRGLLLANATAAITNNQSFSPPIVMQGFGFANIVNNSQDVRFRMYVVPVQANNNPTGIWRLESSINGGSYGTRLTVTSGGAVSANSFSGNLTSTTITATSLIASLAGGQTGAGFQVASQGVVRTTNGGSDLVPDFWAGAPNVVTAGTLAMLMDRSNSLYYSIAASNGTRYITRASMQITNLVNTAGSESADLIFLTQAGGTAMAEKWRIASTGALSNTVAVGTAYIHTKAGTTAASTAPLKFTSGANMTAAEAGAFEFTTDDLYFTITTGTARKNIALWDTLGTSGRIPFATTNGRLTDDADLTFATDTLTTTKLVITTSLTSVGGTAPAADGTYLAPTSITIKSGIITAIS